MIKLKNQKINKLSSKFKQYQKSNNIEIKFYYRPMWWNIRYVRWIFIGKRKFPSRKKKYRFLKLYEKFTKRKKVLFLYKKLKKQFSIALLRKQLNFFLKPTHVTTGTNSIISKVNNYNLLSNFVENFYCVTTAKQAKFIIKKGWILINGKVNTNTEHKLQKADIVSIVPFIWNRLAFYFKKFHPKISYRLKKKQHNKAAKTHIIKKYKNFRMSVIFRKTNSTAYVN